MMADQISFLPISQGLLNTLMMANTSKIRSRMPQGARLPSALKRLHEEIRTVKASSRAASGRRLVRAVSLVMVRRCWCVEREYAAFYAPPLDIDIKTVIYYM